MISRNLEKIVKNKKQVFLLDLSWFLHRYSYSYKDLGVDIDGYHRPTGHIYGVLGVIESLKTAYPECAIIVCQDGEPVERRELYAEHGMIYKEGRKELEFNFYSDNNLIKALSFLVDGVFWAFNEDQESDDIMYALAKQIHEISECEVFVYTGDNDLLQAIDERIYVVRGAYKSGEVIKIDSRTVVSDPKFTKKFHGVDPAHLPIYRAIVGDSSDTLKGVYRFNRKMASRISRSASRLEDIFNFMPVDKAERSALEKLNENRELIELNYKMMKLNDEIEVNLSRSKVDWDKAMGVIDLFQLNKFKRFLMNEREIKNEGNCN